MAKLLGVRTGKFSLIPQPLPDGHLQLGYVEAAHSDILRDSLVGAAPLITRDVVRGLRGGKQAASGGNVGYAAQRAVVAVFAGTANAADPSRFLAVDLSHLCRLQHDDALRI